MVTTGAEPPGIAEEHQRELRGDLGDVTEERFVLNMADAIREALAELLRGLGPDGRNVLPPEGQREGDNR